MTFMFPVGITTACGILVGNAIGEGSERKIKFYYTLSLTIAFALALFQNVILFIFEGAICSIFTDREPIIAQMEKAWFIFNCFVITDCL